MAEQSKSPQHDLVNLDEATEGPLDSGLAASSGESILNAAEVFQQQLEQMTAWKQKLGQQMDLLRRDGIKLMERQKALSLEKKAIADDRAALQSQRTEIQAVQAELEAQGTRLSARAKDLEQAHQQLTEMQARRDQHERELAAREKGLAEQEARHLAEDVRLREGMEQLEGQRRQLVEAGRQAQQQREALDQRAAELTARSQSLDEQGKVLEGREGSYLAARQELEKAQAQARSQSEDLAARERILAEQLRMAAAEQQRLAEEKQAIGKQKLDLQRRVEDFEREQAEQLEALAKQGKRLAERRVALDAAENDLEAALADRIAKATEAMRAELAAVKGGQSDRVAQLDREVRQAEEANRRIREKEQEMERAAAGMRQQLSAVQEQLKAATASLEKVSAERSTLANQLAEQIQQSEKEAAKWQKALDQAQVAGEDKSSQKAQQQVAAAREKIDAFKTQVKQLQAAKDELEFQLEIRAEEHGKELESQKQKLTKQIGLRDEEIYELKQRLEAAHKAQSDDSRHAEQLSEMAGQLAALDRQRNELTSQLALVQESLRREQEVTQQTRTELESQIEELKRERDSWRTGKVRGADGAGDEQLYKQTGWQRQRLLRQAKALRAFRQQLGDTRLALEKGRAEIAQQRDQFRLRKENLEQVKRLLEKQEMVMARKLADHNAIKTVAAAGIFVIMVLGSVFFGVYRFVRPVYRSEAVIQLAAPENSTDVDGWLGKQMAFLRSNEVAYTAWKLLREGDEHYNMHDVREEWLASLGDHLSIARDAGGKALVVRYTGPEAEGVSQVANAIATAYTKPTKRESTDETRKWGMDAQILAKATPAAYPAEDNRLTTFAIVASVVMLVSILAVMVFRHFVRRQLRAIDEMVEGEDLSDGDEQAAAAPVME